MAFQYLAGLFGVTSETYAVAQCSIIRNVVNKFIALVNRVAYTAKTVNILIRLNIDGCADIFTYIVFIIKLADLEVRMTFVVNNINNKSVTVEKHRIIAAAIYLIVVNCIITS